MKLFTPHWGSTSVKLADLLKSQEKQDLVYSAYSLHLSVSENQRLDTPRTGTPRKAFYPLRNDHIELHGLPADHVPHTPAALHERHHRGHTDLHGHLHSHQHTLENQHPHGQQRHDGGRITVLQLHLPVQSGGMALLLHPACRHVRFSPYHRQATYFK